MNRLIYSLMLALLTPLIWLYFIFRGIKDSDYFSGFGERLGFAPKLACESVIHIHCASVGETRAALPLVKKLLQLYPEHDLLITCTTPTGKQEIRNFIQHLGEKRIKLIYLPIDWIGACNRFIERVKPQLSILIETELWPNLIFSLKRQAVPILLANGRMSDSAMQKYFKLAHFSQSFFSKIDRVMAQYQEDSEHYLRLGVAFDRISICGNIKYDLEISAQLIEQQQALRNQWSEHRPCWIAASIHPAEFSIVLKAHKELLQRFPDLLLIAVARHPERFFELKKTVIQHSLNYVLRSQNQTPSSQHSVIIGDTMGEMMQFYGAADVAFVGGSMIGHGGQNPIEPAACGLPVVMGPSYYNFSFVAQEMQNLGVLNIIEAPLPDAQTATLSQAVSRLLGDHQALLDSEKASRQLFKNNQGALEQTLQAVDQLLTK
ncbi:MAG: lipid IV(A) 3-deoxy-D-manno-octulosonic acid transferase [Enterobacterales bacterium]|nr:lipid IV(A) 3-deoxy-D-manno-octulosonic acid transferase [Enterobacterales bacterium]